MKAKLVNEAIKHLAPKSDEDIRKEFDKMSPEDKISNHKDMGINLTQSQLHKLVNQVDIPPFKKLELYKYNNIEISNEEKSKLLGQLTDRIDKEHFKNWDINYHVFRKDNKPWVFQAGNQNILLPYIVMIAKSEEALLDRCNIFTGIDLTFEDIKIKFENYF